MSNTPWYEWNERGCPEGEEGNFDWVKEDDFKWNKKKKKARKWDLLVPYEGEEEAD
jgi:hypothetical protein